MKPTFRSLVWRELPPFMRRAYRRGERFLWLWQRRFTRLRQSWEQTPEWNFVGIAGTVGIVLTILLFLNWQGLPVGELAARDVRFTADSARARPWELDSRWEATETVAQNYAVELEFLPGRALEVAAAPSPRRRHRSTTDNLEPPPAAVAETKFAPAIPVVVQEAVSEPQHDWFAVEQSQEPVHVDEPPDVAWEVEIVHDRPRPVTEAPDVSFTARIEAAVETNVFADSGIPSHSDDWTAFRDDSGFLADHASAESQDDHQTVAAEIDSEPAAQRESLVFPDSAPNSAEVELELAWNRIPRITSSRRGSAQLSVRNIGAREIERIEVYLGPLDEREFPDLKAAAAQTLDQISPGAEHQIRLAQRRLKSARLFSVVTTAFVGGVTDVTAEESAAAPPPRRKPRPDPAPLVSSPPPERATPRPHLRLTAGNPNRLRQHRLLSVPIRVVNDGNVGLGNVVIVAVVPSSLTHRHGQTIHYRVGSLQAGEEHATTLLLTALEAGTAFVPLSVADEQKSASDETRVNLDVVAEDLKPSPKTEPPSSRRRQRKSTDG